MDPLLFLDFDDVLCVSRTHGGRMLLLRVPPPDLYEKLFHAPAVATLLAVLRELSPRIVITTSWLRFLDRAGCVQLFERTGLAAAAALLHEHWDAPQNAGETRLQAIERWMKLHHRGEAYAILDDAESGVGLRGSRHDRFGRVVLCTVDVGLHDGHLLALREALRA